jgi:O-antigen/teichoic acid export membrane protein
MSQSVEVATVSAPRPVPTARRLAGQVARASVIYGIANFGIRALNFVLLPIFTRYLVPAEYGTVVLAETVATLMVKVLSLGLDASIQRLYFQHVDDKDGGVAGYVGSVLKFVLATSVAFIVLALVAGPRLQHLIAPHSGISFRYLALALVGITAAQLIQYRLVLDQCEHRPKAYAALSFFTFALTALLTIGLVVVARRGAGGLLLGKLLAGVIVVAVAVFVTRKAMAAPFRWGYIRESIAIGWPLVPHQLMAMGLISADRFILEHYRGLSEVGIYSMAYNFGMVMSLVTMSLNQAWTPMYYDVARHGEEGRRLLGKMCAGLSVVLVTIACFGALIAGPFVSRLLDPRYAAAGRLVPWIIGAYLAHAMFSFLMASAMQARRSHFLMYASFIALAVNTLLNFALIPRWGMYGAAWATFAAYIFELLAMYFPAQRIYPIDYDLPRTLAALAIFAGVLVATQVRWNPASTWLSGAQATALIGLAAFGLLAALGWSRFRLLLPHRAALAAAQADEGAEC